MVETPLGPQRTYISSFEGAWLYSDLKLLTLSLKNRGSDVGMRKQSDEGRELERKVGRKEGCRGGGSGVERRLGTEMRGGQVGGEEGKGC